MHVMLVLPKSCIEATCICFRASTRLIHYPHATTLHLLHPSFNKSRNRHYDVATVTSTKHLNNVTRRKRRRSRWFRRRSGRTGSTRRDGDQHGDADERRFARDGRESGARCSLSGKYSISLVRDAGFVLTGGCL